MNSKEKEIFQKLLSIASKQQKIIQKLAQQGQVAPPGTPELTVPDQPAPPGPAAPPPAGKFEPGAIQKMPGKALWEALPPHVQGTLATAPEVRGSEMHIKFKPNQATQANYDAVMKTLQGLTSGGTIQHPYKLRVV